MASEMSSTDESITDALRRLIDNDNDTYDGNFPHARLTRIGLYHGTRQVILAAYVEAYDHDIAPIGTHHAAARVAAMDALKEYIEECVSEEASTDGLPMLAATLVQCALDRVDWRDLTRSILQSCAESTPGYYQMDGEGQAEATLAVAREEV